MNLPEISVRKYESVQYIFTGASKRYEKSRFFRLKLHVMKKIKISFILFCISFLNIQSGVAQNLKTFNDRPVLKRSNFSIEITASVLPKAIITRTEGSYRLHSHLQSAYDAGINYIYNFNENLSVSSGLRIIIGKRNFFLNVPSEDLSRYNLNGHLIIEDKEIWNVVSVPVWFEKRIDTKKAGLIAVKAGLSLRYSGFMNDLVMKGGGIIDSNNYVINIFSAYFSGNNNNKPWLTFLAGLSKLFVLDNQNILSVSLQADISATYFFKGSYSITIPDKPVTNGTYRINGTSLGLSVQYIFTGANKRLVRTYQKNDF